MVPSGPWTGSTGKSALRHHSHGIRGLARRNSNPVLGSCHEAADHPSQKVRPLLGPFWVEGPLSTLSALDDSLVPSR
jgi:hypothetical protein